MDKIYNYVYVTTNSINGKRYVGDHSTNNIEDEYLGSGRPYFKNAMKKYGKENFKKKILKHFETKQEAFDAQEKYINEYNTLAPNGYNISPKGGHKMKGSMSEETKRKIGNANKISLKGINPSPESIEKRRKSMIGKKHSLSQRKNISNSLMGRKSPMEGKHHTNETKIKISESNRGRKLSEETKEKIKRSHLGKKLTEEHKNKISKSNKGRSTWNKGMSLSQEHKDNIGKGNKGKKYSDETKLKMSLASRGKPKSEEHKKKCGLANLGKRRPRVVCGYCQKEYADYMYKLYHGDNCKFKDI